MGNLLRLIFTSAIGDSIYVLELYILEIIYPKLNAWHKDDIYFIKLTLIIFSNYSDNVAQIFGSSYMCSKVK